MTRIRHWQDVGSLLLGCWLMESPWVLGLTGPSAWFTGVMGLFVVLFAIEGLLIPSYLEEWAEIALGLALIIGPLAMGYYTVLAGISSIVSGILIIIFATWELLTDREFLTWWNERWGRKSV